MLNDEKGIVAEENVEEEEDNNPVMAIWEEDANLDDIDSKDIDFPHINANDEVLDPRE